MSNPSLQQYATVTELANRIEDDIRQRGLRPGDAYLTTAETARMLRAGMAPVTQALRLLVKRKVVQRKQRVGTIVGKNFDTTPETPLRQVRILMYDPHLIEEGLFNTEFLLGLQSAVLGAHIQFDFVPFAAHEEERYIREVVDDALQCRHSEGFILFNSTVQIQRAFRESGLPSLVAGSLYGSSQELPCIDRDQKQIGRLLAEYLLARGHQRILMVTRQRPGLGPGEYLVADAVAEAASSANLSANALQVRSLPHDPEIVRAEMQHYLEECTEPPGILLRPWQMIEPVYAAIEAVGWKPQQDVAVVVADYYPATPTPPTFPVIRSTMSREDHGFQCGQMLLDCVRKVNSETSRILIPVRLEVPSALEA